MRALTLTFAAAIAAMAGGTAPGISAPGGMLGEVSTVGRGAVLERPTLTGQARWSHSVRPPSPAACATEESPAQPLSFWRDANLKQRLSYAEPTIALGDLVHRVAADTGVSLGADSAVADEPVAVAVKEMPAHELLERLASLLDYRWSRHGKEGSWRFEIWQDLASRQREERLREAAMEAQINRLRAEINLHVAVASLPIEQQRQLLDEARRRRERRASMSDEQWGQFTASPQDAARSRVLVAAAHVSEPAARALAILLGRVTEPQWLAVAQSGSLAFSTKPETGELPLPADIADALRAADGGPSGPLASPEAPVDEDRHPWEARQKREWQMASDFRVTLTLGGAVLQYRTGDALNLEVNAVPLATPEPGGSPFFVPGSWNALFLSVGPAPPGVDSARDPARRATMEKDPVLRKSATLRPGPALRSGPPGLFSPEGPAPWRLPELLPAIARAYGVQILADAYWSAPIVRPSQIPSEPTPLFALLDRLAGSRCNWDREGTVIRLRSRTWFLDRPREVPLRLLRRWEDQCRRYGALSLDEYASGVSTLTDEQMESLESMVEEGLLPNSMQDLAGAYAWRHALRLLGSLSRTQREALWGGRALPMQQMAPAQRTLFLAALEDRARYSVLPVSAIDERSARLSLVIEPFIRMRGEREAPTAGQGEQSAGQGRAERPPRPGPTARRPFGAGRFPLDRLQVRFTYGPGMDQTAWVTVTPPQPAAAGPPTPSPDEGTQGGIR